MYVSARLPPPFQQTGQVQHALALLESHHHQVTLSSSPPPACHDDEAVPAGSSMLGASEKGGGHHVLVTFLCYVAVRFILMKGGSNFEGK
jgi:hypothetical protein